MGRPATYCTVDGCESRHVARGYCRAHYKRWQRHGNPLAGPVRGRRTTMPPLYIEDVEWMAETGEGWENAARRVGYTSLALEKALERQGRGDLISRLKRNRSAAWA